MLITGHDQFTSGGSVSNHYVGRGLDIATVDGEIVRPNSIASRELAEALADLPESIRPTEVGTPWPIDAPGFFTDGAPPGSPSHRLRRRAARRVSLAGHAGRRRRPPAASAAGPATARAVSSRRPAANGGRSTVGAIGAVEQQPRRGAAAGRQRPPRPPRSSRPRRRRSRFPDVSDVYPGDDAPKEQIAAWMARQAHKAGLPGELPIMAALVESRLVEHRLRPRRLDRLLPDAHVDLGPGRVQGLRGEARAPAQVVHRPRAAREAEASRSRRDGVPQGLEQVGRVDRRRRAARGAVPRPLPGAARRGARAPRRGAGRRAAARRRRHARRGRRGRRARRRSAGEEGAGGREGVPRHAVPVGRRHARDELRLLGADAVVVQAGRDRDPARHLRPGERGGEDRRPSTSSRPATWSSSRTPAATCTTWACTSASTSSSTRRTRATWSRSRASTSRTTRSSSPAAAAWSPPCPRPAHRTAARPRARGRAAVQRRGRPAAVQMPAPRAGEPGERRLRSADRTGAGGAETVGAMPAVAAAAGAPRRSWRRSRLARPRARRSRRSLPRTWPTRTRAASSTPPSSTSRTPRARRAPRATSTPATTCSRRRARPVRSPIEGTIVEVKASRGNTGQIFGGTVKVRGEDGRVWVFRHVDPKGVVEGGKVTRRPGDRLGHRVDRGHAPRPHRALEDARGGLQRLEHGRPVRRAAEGVRGRRRRAAAGRPPAGRVSHMKGHDHGGGGELADAGPAPTPSAELEALLANPKLELPEAARADLASGQVDPRMVSVLDGADEGAHA